MNALTPMTLLQSVTTTTDNTEIQYKHQQFATKYIYMTLVLTKLINTYALTAVQCRPEFLIEPRPRFLNLRQITFV